MAKKKKEQCMLREVTFAISLLTPEGVLPMKHKFLGMDEDTKEVFAFSVANIIKVMGYDPDDYGLQMCLTPMVEVSKRM